MSVRCSRSAAAVAAFALAAASVTPSAAGAAQTAAPAPVAVRDARTFATIVVNGQERAEHLVLFKANGVFASLRDLRADGLVIPPRFAALDDNQDLDVKELSPEIVAVFDRNGPTLRFKAASTRWLTQRTTMSLITESSRAVTVIRPRSGFLNYSVRGGSAGVSGAEALTLSDGSKTFTSAGTFDRHGFRHGSTAITWQNAEKRRAATIGDVFADSGALGSAVQISGVNVARTSAANASGGNVTTPLLHGSVLTPSTADVFINGQLVRSIELAPGTYDFSDLPGSGNVTDATIVLRDAFGRTQTLSTRYYGASSVLAKGANDYSFSAGRVRPPFETNQMKGMVALGRYRVGLTRSTTAGAHAEFGNGFENFGAGIDQVGRLGTWGVYVAESRRGGATGYAGALTYATGSNDVWFNAYVHAATSSYETVGDRGNADRAVDDQRLSIGLRPFGGGYTTTFSYASNRSLVAGFGRRLAWQQSIPLRGGISLFTSFGMSQASGRPQRDIEVSIIRSARRSSEPSVTATLRNRGASVEPAIEMQRSIPTGLGTGYYVTAFPLGPSLSTGRYGVHSAIANVDVSYDLARTGSFKSDTTVSGAIAFAGPYVRMSQPIEDDFAIVRAIGGTAVKVLVDNREAGVTDRGGFLVLPNLRSYSSQRVGVVRDDDGPVNLAVTSGDRTVALAAHHGAVLTFSASVVTAIVGMVNVRDASPNTTPSFGQLQLTSDAGSVTSELDRDGRFYFEDIKSGTYRGLVRYAGGECRFMLAVPATTQIQHNLGVVTCAKNVAADAP